MQHSNSLKQSIRGSCRSIYGRVNAWLIMDKKDIKHFFRNVLHSIETMVIRS